ncbi:hypothetical protein C8Q72DRAFT_840733 [Fomitopsis betulina]|nr:hypothetical protein C8Q72DRAFT_840733 [Fomitopsis betulina]
MSPIVYDEPRYDLLLGSADMLSILGRCAGVGLDELSLEYRVDEGEDALLRFVVVNFPRLMSLKLHRYSSVLENETRNVSQATRHLAELLAPLSQLRRFKVHLDCVELPYLVDSMGFNSGSGGEISNAAMVFAKVLSSSLRVLMVRSVTFKTRPMWHAFDIDDRMLLDSDQ